MNAAGIPIWNTPPFWENSAGFAVYLKKRMCYTVSNFIRSVFMVGFRQGGKQKSVKRESGVNPEQSPLL